LCAEFGVCLEFDSESMNCDLVLKLAWLCDFLDLFL